MKIVKRFNFDSAHYLPRYAGKCKQLHGHTYTLEVIIDGEVNKDTGMVMDFYDIDYIVKSRVLDGIDHKLLNDIIENPTTENIAIFISNEIRKNIDKKIGIRLWETGSNYVELLPAPD